jgi:hypothetical protein
MTTRLRANRADRYTRQDVVASNRQKALQTSMTAAATEPNRGLPVKMLDRRAFFLSGLALAAGQGDYCPEASPLPSVALSLDPARWQIGPMIDGRSYSPGMPTRPSADGSGWTFAFPEQDGVHYVTTPLRGSLMGRSVVRARFTITGPGRLVPTQGDPPARLRLFLQRSADNFTATGPYEFYRWWSVSSVALVAGQHELTTALAPDQWLSVLGKRGDHPAAAGQFASAIVDLQAIGQTFGGMFAGHGVYVIEGWSNFGLMSYEIL